MINHILAWTVVGLLLTYWVAEEWYGGGRRGYDWRGHMPKDVLWIRWRRRGLYPPEPPADGPKKPIKPKPKMPELIDG